MPTPILNQLQSQPILILGFAREGQSTYKFLRSRYPDLPIGIADQKVPDSLPKDPHITTFFGPDYLTQSLKPEHYSLVIKTPGIPPHFSEIIAAKNRGVIFTSQVQIFFELCPGRIIGITGTKGKSTTTSLIHHVLNQNKIKTILVGNIGKPPLDYLDQIDEHTWVVEELSSYQLLDVEASPHIAVMQAVYPDHLDYHQSFDEYLSAKQNIARFQSPQDYFIYNTDNAYCSETATLTPATKIPFGNPIIPIPSKLIGAHNQYNIQPAIIIGKLLNISEEKILESIGSFIPLDTRLEKIGTFKDITFYSDTLATIPEATIAAIDALSPQIETLIVGGHDRKQNYSELADKILITGIKTLILFPATGQRIWHEIKKINPHPNIRNIAANSMNEAISQVYQNTSPGKAVLLSPAAPSFTLFKDYKDEYEQYKQSIVALS